MKRKWERRKKGEEMKGIISNLKSVREGKGGKYESVEKGRKAERK